MTTFFEIILVMSNITTFILMTLCLLVLKCNIPKSVNDAVSHGGMYISYWGYEKSIISSALITAIINSLLSIINVIVHLYTALVTLCIFMLVYTAIFVILFTCLNLRKSYTDKICRVFSFIKLNTDKFNSQVAVLFSDKSIRSSLFKTYIEPLNKLILTARSFNTLEKKFKFYEEVVYVKIEEFVNAMNDKYNELKLQDESVIDAFKKRI